MGSLQDAVNIPFERSHAKGCGVARWVKGLSEGEQKAVATLFSQAESGARSLSQVARLLRESDNGIKLGEGVIRSHYRNECSCPR